MAGAWYMEVREGTRGGRLAMHCHAADTAASWEAHWRGDPPRRMRGQPIARSFRDAFTRFLPQDGLIIEAGCGNGNVLRTVASAGYEIEGVDFAAEAIEANRAIDPSGRYRVGDVRHLPYGDGEAAAYISLGVIEHFDDETRGVILREAARVLRPGGVALISTPYYSPLRRARAMVGGYRNRDEGRETLPFYQYFFSARELKGFVTDAGLRPVAIETYDTYKGAKDTLGIRGKRVLDAVRRIGPRSAAFVEHGPRAMRRMCGHMVMVIAEKPREAAGVRGVGERIAA